MQTEIDLVTCTEFPIVNRRVLVNMFKLISLYDFISYRFMKKGKLNHKDILIFSLP